MTFTPADPAVQVWGLGPYESPELCFNGTDDYGIEWIIRPVDGWTSSQVELPVINSAGDGGWYGTGRRTSRVLTITGLMRAARSLDPQADLDAAEDRFRNAVELLDRDQTLWVTERVPKQVAVRQSGPCVVDPMPGSQRVRTFSVVLTAADPNKYAAGASGPILVPLALAQPTFAGMAFPAKFPASFGGTLAVLNRAVVTNPGRLSTTVLRMYGPTPTNPTLINATTGDYFGLTTPLAAGSVAVIDCVNETLYIDGVSRLSARSSGSEFWSVGSGLQDLRYVADDYSAGATASVQFTPAWR